MLLMRHRNILQGEGMARLAKEICQDCEKIFLGGPKAFLCPACRKKRVIQGRKRGKKDGAKKDVYDENS